MDYFIQKRKSYMEIGEIFFSTVTINGWQHLLQKDQYKEIVLQSLNWLCSTGKLDVFAFIIMPNHIYLIWRANAVNGRETVQGSVLKYIAHEFRKLLLKEDGQELQKYAVQATNKQYEFWQRDSLAVHLYTPGVAYHKLEYIHLNPLTEHWNLVSDPSDYYYSTALLYEKGALNFSFVKDLRKEF